MKWIVAAVAIVLAVIVSAVQLSRPLPAIAVKISHATTALPGKPPSITWQSGPESALAVAGIGTVGSHGPSTPVPIGSVAKMMTAYLLLQKHPLGQYSSGPSLKVTAADAAVYQADANSQQSVAPVVAGETLSERQLIEGLLVASGNNIATMVADWVAGSPHAFSAMMNAEAAKLGMTQTHYEGPSGLNPATVSTPGDEIKLAETAMKLPAFRQIAAMPQVTWPNVPRPIYNFDYVVGHYGIIGVKTGSTVQAGGCFVFAAPRPSSGAGTVMVYGAVLGQSGSPNASQLQASLADGVNLLTQASGIVKSYSLIKSGQAVGYVSVPWGRSIAIDATGSVTVAGWGGMPVSEHLSLVAPGPGSSRGTLTVTQGARHWTIPVALSSPVPAAPLSWRLVHG
ncbi:MAG: hypothetical protein M0Z53_08520 [Thermaerobacter sp.]|nr:hypothetical protein [Thermaerobacter sp.]